MLFCGLDDKEQKVLSKAEQAAMEYKMTDITEEKWPSIIVNIGGVIMLSSGVFLFGFYA